MQGSVQPDDGFETCEDFFAHTGPATRRKLDTLLRTRGVTGGSGWLIDMLGLTRQRLRAPTHDFEPSSRHDA